MVSRPTFSLEFFPPKDAAGESRLWDSLRQLAEHTPDFVSVTYGAGGSTRDRTIRVTEEITKRTGIATVAHLTCVGATEDELTSTLARYRSAGIRSILALRGDPEGGPSGAWQTIPGGFDHADQLVSLAKSLGFEVGVAAFPDGHPATNDFEQDINVLIEKERRGATSATTQFFFRSDRYFKLRDALATRGSKLPIIAGILPITNVRQLERMAQLGGTEIPAPIKERVLAVEPERVREVGIEIAVELGRELMAGGVPGLHFYTMNSATSTIGIIKELGLR